MATAVVSKWKGIISELVISDLVNFEIVINGLVNYCTNDD